MSACAWLLACCLVLAPGDDDSIDVPEAKFVPRTAKPNARESRERGAAADQEPASGRRSRPKLFDDHTANESQAEHDHSDADADADPPARRAGDARRPGDARGTVEGADRGTAAKKGTGASGREGAAALQPVPPGQKKQRPPELIAEALADPEEAAVTGTPWRLADAIAKANSRPKQLAVVQAYWKLAAAEMNYYFALDQRKRFVAVEERHELDPPIIRATRNAARAATQDADAAVRRAQHALGELLDVQPDEELPLAIDRPHSGSYETYFQKIYEGKSAPARMWLIHNTLPDRREAIDAHAEAVQYALDAWEATAEDYAGHKVASATLISAWDALARSRRKFVSAVREYNLAIAEYALQVAPATADGRRLAEMLIKSTRTAAGAAGRNAEGRIGPAADGEPPDDSADHQPTRSGLQAVSYASAAVSPLDPLYAGLVDVDGPLRAQKLADVLYENRKLPVVQGNAVSLNKYLNRVPSSKRRDSLSAYWKLSEQLARLQAADEHARQIGELRSAALALRGEPGGASVMLRWAAASWAARARRIDDQVALKASQFEATQTIGQPLAGAWVLPLTPPHAGRYRTVKPATKEQAKDSRQPAALVELYQDRLESLASAIVQFDAARVDSINTDTLQAEGRVTSGVAARALTPDHIDAAIGVTERQARETRRFLRQLTNYNAVIGDYALAVSARDLPVARLVDMLVTKRAQQVASGQL